MKLLHILYPNDEPSGVNPLQELFPDAEVYAENINTLDEWLEGGAYFDIIYCAHSLTALEAKKVPEAIRTMAALLNERGELWLAVPSLEWAMREIQSEEPSPAIHVVIYGDKDHPARCGFTLAWLRQLVEQAMLIPRRAYHGLYQVQIGEQAVQIPLAVCVGWKA